MEKQNKEARKKVLEINEEKTKWLVITYWADDRGFKVESLIQKNLQVQEHRDSDILRVNMTVKKMKSNTD